VTASTLVTATPAPSIALALPPVLTTSYPSSTKLLAKSVNARLSLTLTNARGLALARTTTRAPRARAPDAARRPAPPPPSVVVVAFAPIVVVMLVMLVTLVTLVTLVVVVVRSVSVVAHTASRAS
jgi:hypothetical protein